MTDQTKFVLPESEMPKAWYNIQADLPFELPPVLHPGTKQPVGPDDLAPLFPMALIQQEVTKERWIEIPEPVRDVYRLWRPTPLFRARRLEKALQTPAQIYYKYEGVSPAGSHKPNTAVAQAYYNKEAGREAARHRDRRRPVGQRARLRRPALRHRRQGLHGAGELRPEALPPQHDGDLGGEGRRLARAPTRTPAASVLAEDPNCSGSLGLAISEAVEDAVTSKTPTKYALGSVLNHVLLHQTVIGLETKRQLDMVGDYPDVVVGCIGGGSNFAGFAYPFLAGQAHRQGDRTCGSWRSSPRRRPSLTRGVYAYDFGDTA